MSSGGYPNGEETDSKSVAPQGVEGSSPLPSAGGRALALPRGPRLCPFRGRLFVAQIQPRAALVPAPTGTRWPWAAASSVSDQFNDCYPGRELPGFVWLDITGAAGVSDFGVGSDGRLIVSESALEALKHTQLDNCSVSEFSLVKE